MKFTYPFSPATLIEVRRELKDDGFFRKPTSPGRFRIFAFVETGKDDCSTSIVIIRLKGRLVISVKGPNTIGMRFDAEDGQFTHESVFHFFTANDVGITSIVTKFLNDAKAARDSA